MNRIFSVSVGILGVFLLLFALDIVAVLLGGFRLQLGNISIRSATIEFPVIGFLVSLILILVIKGKWKDAILFGGALLVSGILGEGLLRLVDHPLAQPYLRSYIEPSSLLGSRLVPGYQGFGPLDIPMKVNSQGFRDIEHQWEKDQETFRIIGLGDSFAFGWGVPIESSFLKGLESALEKKTERSFEAINAGVPGWGLNNYYFYLKYIGQKYSPNVVVLAYYVDDLGNGFIEDATENSEDPFPEKPKNHQLNFEGGFLHHFRLYNFLKSLADQIRYRNRNKQIDYLANVEARRKELNKREGYLLSQNEGKSQEQFKLFLRKHLSRMKSFTDEIEASLMIMLIPDAAQLHHHEVQFINAKLAEYSQANNIPFLDMTPIFEQSAELETYYLLPRDWHTNVLGHKKMAEALVPLVCHMLDIKKVACDTEEQ